MICEHLREIEAALVAAGAVETCRGRVWSGNCREWVYFEVVFDVAAIRERFALAPCVRVCENLDRKSGVERGFRCETCLDGVMGVLEGAPVFPRAGS